MKPASSPFIDHKVSRGKSLRAHKPKHLSRRFHFWITDCEDAEHTYEGLIRAFEHFGGVTDEVLVDNQKSTVLSRDAHGRVRYNPAFLDLCGRFGVTPRACRPYRARTKGKVERMVGYIKHNFFKRYRSFASIEEANNLAAASMTIWS